MIVQYVDLTHIDNSQSSDSKIKLACPRLNFPGLLEIPKFNNY